MLAEILGKLGFDWQVAIANLVNFLIIFYLLKRFLWKPLSETIENREKIIKEGLENAEQAKTDFVMAEEKAKEIIAKAKAEGNEIIAKAKNNADKMIADAKEKAEASAAAILSAAEIRIKKTEQESIQTVREKSADLITLVAEKFLGKKLADSDDILVKKLIKES